MKKFLSGVLTATLVFSLAVSALAASGTVSFNLSPIALNGEIISAAGKGYTLANGCEAPASITYTDEKGGGTTYLPARRVSELLDVDIGWDAATGAVTIGQQKADAQDSTADTTAEAGTILSPETIRADTDFSSWSANDEDAYQDFKTWWDLEYTTRLVATYSGNLSYGDLASKWETNAVQYEAFCRRMVIEENPVTVDGCQLYFLYEKTEMAFSAVYFSGPTHYVYYGSKSR